MIRQSVPSLLVYQNFDKKINSNVKNNYQLHFEMESKLHPFFGYIDSNENFELLSNLKKKNDEYVIGIFGGSVAQHLYGINISLKLIEKKFSQVLKIPLHKIKIINFANGGYRQPQQNIMANIYAEKIDFSLNLEGVNELWFYFSDYLPFYYPNPALSKKRYLDYDINEKYLRYKNIKARNHILDRLLTSEYRLKIFEVIDLIRYKKIDKYLDDLIDENKKKHSFYFDGEHERKNLLDFWLKLSCLQQNTFTSIGKKSIFFVQPVPYLNKILSKKEKIFLSNLGDDQIEIKKALNKLNFSKLKSNGFNIYSLLNVFENNKEDLYVDSCCHLNEKGNLLLLKSIISNLSNQILSKPTFCNFNKISDI